MAKIRTIKPDFWTDGVIIRLPLEVRLFYIGMWNHACDRGHLADDPLGLKLKVLPADPVDGDDMIGKLIEVGRVQRIELEDGRPYLHIPRFSDHQRIETRWKSRCPACDSADLAETRARFSEPRSGSRELAEGREGKGKEGKGREGAAATTPEAPAPTCQRHSGWDHADPCRACAADRKASVERAGEELAAARRESRRKPHACEHGFPPHEACDRGCGDAWPGR